MARVRINCGTCGAHFDLAASVARLTTECPRCHAPIIAAKPPPPAPPPTTAGAPHRAPPPSVVPLAAVAPATSSPTIRCPSCGNQLQLPVGLTGQAVACPYCATQFRISAQGAIATATAIAVPAPVSANGPAAVDYTITSAIAVGFGILIRSAMRVFGGLAIIVGLVVLVRFFNTDTSIETQGGMRVNNLGLMAEQRNGMIIGAVVTGVGCALLLVGELSGRAK